MNLNDKYLPMLKSAIVTDTETTGLDHLLDQVVEFAGLKVLTDEFFSSFCGLDKRQSIPPETKAIHHITEADVSGFAPPSHILGDMLNSLGDPKIAIAHNAAFDRPFFNDITQGQWNPIWICTYKCAVMTWPDAPKHSNQVLRYWLGLDLPFLGAFPGLMPHRALYDIICTRGIFFELLKVNTIEQMAKWSSGPVLLPKVMFGKHVGKTWDQVDAGYLNWCIREPDMNEDVKYTATYWRDQRRK